MEGGLAAPDDAISMANGPSGMTAAPSTIMSSSGAIIGGAGSSALDTRSISSEFHNRPPSMAGWPSSTGNNTMSKRSASRQQQFSGYRPGYGGAPSGGGGGGGGVHPPLDSLIKDYTKKRWLILALLSVEVETMAVNESPLETRESLVALLSNRYFSNNSLGNIGKQFDDAMKFLEEVRS